MKTIGIVMFDGVEELDFVGPWEVFTMARELAGAGEVLLVAEHDRPIVAAKGMRVLPDRTFATAPPLDVLVVPGGDGRRREVTNEAMLAYLRSARTTAKWITSVCTGAFLLHHAGLSAGKRTTTHWARIEELRAVPGTHVVEGERFVVDGDVVTAAGVSAGIDMALWIVGQEKDPDFARRVQKNMEYFPEPPYA
jgi:transcriptional regulator GlxA family with amidase domain